MSNCVQRIVDCELPPINVSCVLRYMGAKSTTQDMEHLIYSCIEETKDCFGRRVCYLELAVADGRVALGSVTVNSASFASALANCNRVLLFAATIGLEIDRLIAKYSRLSPARALCLQAIGTERIEALCDAFCHHMKTQYASQGLHTRPRFSPGYGDLPLELQKDIFRLLDCPKNIGLSLNDSLLMTPTKSVTAFVGLFQ